MSNKNENKAIEASMPKIKERLIQNLDKLDKNKEVWLHTGFTFEGAIARFYQGEELMFMIPIFNSEIGERKSRLALKEILLSEGFKLDERSRKIG